MAEHSPYVPVSVPEWTAVNRAHLSEPHASNGTVPLRLFMTSDVRAATGLSRTHLDFYIRESLVRPVARTESGYLLFDQQEVEMLRSIVEARRQGIGLREIREQFGR